MGHLEKMSLYFLSISFSKSRVLVCVWCVLSFVRLFVTPMDCSRQASSVYGISQTRILEWGCHFLLQGIFLTQGSSPQLLHLLYRRQILYCWKPLQFSSVQFSPQLCLTLCNSMNRSMPGLPVHHQRPEFTQTHVHRVHDAIQLSHPRSSPSPPAPSPSQHQSLFQ